MELLTQVGFLGIAQNTFFLYDNNLISTLVERWRPETDMSHMSVGDCTITLQEVSTLLDLPIDGKPVTSAGSDD